jgi:HEAT repeat protein
VGFEITTSIATVTSERMRKLDALHGEPIPYDAPIEFLRTRLRKSGKEAWAAFRALAEHPEPEAMSILVELTHSSDPHMRRAALEGIGYHRCGHDASARAESMLHDTDSFVVRTACAVAAILGLADAHDRILELVGASDESTRLSALMALESLWSPTDFETVFARYLNDRSDRVRKQAASILFKNVGPEHWKRLFALWSKDSLPRHRVWACSIAERFGDRTVLESLNALRSDKNGHVRRAAERAASRPWTSVEPDPLITEP